MREGGSIGAGGAMGGNDRGGGADAMLGGSGVKPEYSMGPGVCVGRGPD